MHNPPTRRDFSIIALLGVSAFAAQAAGAADAVQMSTEHALKAIDPWLDALSTGDPVLVEKVLAPEYQILRSNGVGHDKASYLKALPRHRVRPAISDIVATSTAGVIVARYRIETDQTIDGKEVKGVSPRLSVFRREGDRWLISAHANFAQLE